MGSIVQTLRRPRWFQNPGTSLLCVRDGERLACRAAYKAKARLIARCVGVLNFTIHEVSTSRWTGFIRFGVTDRWLL